MTVAVLLTAVLIPGLSQVFAVIRLSGATGCAAVVALFVLTQTAQISALTWFRQPVVAELPARLVAVAGFTLMIGLIMTTRRDLVPVAPVPDPVRRDSARRATRWGAVAVGVIEIVVLTVVVLQLR